MKSFKAWMEVFDAEHDDIADKDYGTNYDRKKLYAQRNKLQRGYQPHTLPEPTSVPLPRFTPASFFSDAHPANPPTQPPKQIKPEKPAFVPPVIASPALTYRPGSHGDFDISKLPYPTEPGGFASLRKKFSDKFGISAYRPEALDIFKQFGWDERFSNVAGQYAAVTGQVLPKDVPTSSILANKKDKFAYQAQLFQDKFGTTYSSVKGNQIINHYGSFMKALKAEV